MVELIARIDAAITELKAIRAAAVKLAGGEPDELTADERRELGELVERRAARMRARGGRP